MNPFNRTLLEALTLVVFSVAIGFSANALRGSGRINPAKNYFDRTLSPDVIAPSHNPQGNGEVKSPGRPNPPADPPKPPPATPAVPPQAHADHPFQKATFADVKAAYEDPGAEVGVYVFIDARSDDNFEAGHIPRAIPCYPYEVESYIDRVLSNLANAEKVFVYCGGGECEDSIFLCRELIASYDVPYNKVYLYEGGWKEWTLQNMPTATGPAE